MLKVFWLYSTEYFLKCTVIQTAKYSKCSSDNLCISTTRISVSLQYLQLLKFNHSEFVCCWRLWRICLKGAVWTTCNVLDSVHDSRWHCSVWLCGRIEHSPQQISKLIATLGLTDNCTRSGRDKINAVLWRQNIDSLLAYRPWWMKLRPLQAP